ncbi:MAG TPA: hypothetical protein VMV60_01870 [Thermoanaerobaculia bacterium]|nr:hypothetical protein [Thermoanaerobaculia bacterium]
MAIDNMYRRRRLGPPFGARMALSIPPSVFFPTLGFLYMAFLDHPRRPRPALLYVFAPITTLGATKDIGLAAMLVLLDVLLWIAVINGILTGIGWLFEKPEPRP